MLIPELIHFLHAIRFFRLWTTSFFDTKGILECSNSLNGSKFLTITEVSEVLDLEAFNLLKDLTYGSFFLLDDDVRILEVRC